MAKEITEKDFYNLIPAMSHEDEHENADKTARLCFQLAQQMCDQEGEKVEYLNKVLGEVINDHNYKMISMADEIQTLESKLQSTKSDAVELPSEEDVKELLLKLDDEARSYDAREYGLPIYLPDDKLAFIQIVSKWMRDKFQSTTKTKAT